MWALLWRRMLRRQGLIQHHDPISVSTEWDVLSRKDTTPKAIVLFAQNRCPFLTASQHHQLSERTLLFNLWTCIYSYVWNIKNNNGCCWQRRNAWNSSQLETKRQAYFSVIHLTAQIFCLIKYLRKFFWGVTYRMRNLTIRRSPIICYSTQIVGKAYKTLAKLS